nr:MAG TPA: hypothetical protein [Caudoviricetes sp.]
MIKRFIYLNIVSIEWECSNLYRIMICRTLY